MPARQDAVQGAQGSASCVQEDVLEVVVPVLLDARQNAVDAVIVVQIVLHALDAVEAVYKHAVQYAVIIVVGVVDVVDVVEHVVMDAPDAQAHAQAAKHVVDVPIHVLGVAPVHVMWDATMDVRLHVCHHAVAHALRHAQDSQQYQLL